MFGYTEKEVAIAFKHPATFTNVTGASEAGIAATVTEPSRQSTETSKDALPENRQNRVVVLCHGSKGHRDYIYQKQLARQLAEQHGLYVVRFDFRGYGFSQPVDSPNGLTRFSESTDIQVVMDYVTRVMKLSPCAIVAHSRAVSAMFDWALLQQLRPGGIFVPNLINCSGRFFTEYYVKEMYKNRPDWLTRSPLTLSRQRFGEELRVAIPNHEIISMSGYDLDLVKYLRPDTHVLTIQGDSDQFVPVHDAETFDRLLNDVSNRHTLEIVKGADHIFNLNSSNSSGTRNEISPNALQHVCNLISDYLSITSENARFNAQNELMPVTAAPRWKKVDNVINFRDFGGYATSLRSKETGRRLWVRPNLLYRSGKLDWCGPEACKVVKELGVTQIYDLRSASELRPNKLTPDGLVHIPDVGTLHNPVFNDKSYSPEAMVERATKDETRLDIMYAAILEEGVSAYRSMFEYLRDNEDCGILVHCSAGKDRTGMFCALLLLLLGVDENTVAHEYELSTIGYAPEREKVLKAVADGTIRPVNESHTGMPLEAWASLLSSQFGTMMDTIYLVNTKYGGIMNYLTTVVGLSRADIDTIRGNLLYEGEPVHVARRWQPKL